MIAIDTHILVYAHFACVAKHKVALAKLTQLAEGSSRWGIPIFCIGEFLRVVTHRRLFEVPMGADEALDAMRRLTRAPSLSVLLPGEQYLALLEQAVRESQASGNLIFDAQVVALCREVGVQALLTEDRDYTRFTAFPTLRLA